MMDEERTPVDLWSFIAQSETPATISETGKREAQKRLISGGPIPPTVSQVAKLRLILSTYQDGTGQLPGPNNMTLPGWRDFERVVAAAFDGQAQESKHVFDVIVPKENQLGKYGVSCKMRGELNKSVDRVNRKGLSLKGRISMELSNSAK